MEYLLDFNLTLEDLNALKTRLSDEDIKKLEMFSRIVKENYGYLNNMNISNMKDVFINHYNMFLMNPDKFKAIFVKYDQADLVRCIEKNHNVIEKL
jgi:hypothetical protein